jgi:hypothetical protein
MLEQLRGRNLAHVGCTLGLLAGLVVGLILAAVIVQVIQTKAAVNWATGVWLGLTFALGVVGYIAGGRFTARLWGTDRPRDERD